MRGSSAKTTTASLRYLFTKMPKKKALQKCPKMATCLLGLEGGSSDIDPRALGNRGLREREPEGNEWLAREKGGNLEGLPEDAVEVSARE